MKAYDNKYTNRVLFSLLPFVPDELDVHVIYKARVKEEPSVDKCAEPTRMKENG